MTVSKAATSTAAKASRPARREPAEAATESTALQLGELSEHLGYALKRAQLKIFEDFLRCVAPLQLTPAQFSVLLLLDKNPGRNQTEIANTLGILRPNFVAMLDELANVNATVYGITAKKEISHRTPTLCFNLPGIAPAKVTEALAVQNIGVRDGHMYSPRLMKRLGLAQESGAVRASLVHYNTLEEVRRFGSALAEMAQR